MNVAIYTRLSDDRDGPTDRQEADCLAHAERHGWTVAEVYTDHDQSAYQNGGGERPAFREMMGQLDRFDALVFWKVDRLVRRVVQFGKVLEAAENAGTSLVCVQEPLDTSSGMGKGVAAMFAAMAEQESQNISVRVSRAVEDRALQGLPCGGPRTFGYCGGPKDDDHPGQVSGMELVESEAQVIRDAVAALRARRLEGWATVATDWNARGIKPPRAEKWSASTVKSLLTSARIAGQRVHHDEVVAEAAWPAIVSRADHEWLLARVTTGKPGRREANLLTNIAVCERCGLGMRTAWTGKPSRRVYKCNKDGGCYRSITGDGLDDYITAAVLGRLAGPGLLEALSVRDSSEDDLAELVRQVDEAEAALVDLARESDELGLEQAEYRAKREVRLRRRDDLRKRLRELASETVVVDLPLTEAELRSAWEDAAEDVAWRRRVVSAVLDRVVVKPVRVNGPRRFDPGRVELRWVA